MIVDKDSATLGLSSQREQQIGLDADHSQICKISSDRVEYAWISRALLELFQKALRKSFPTKDSFKETDSAGCVSLDYLTKLSGSPSLSLTTRQLRATNADGPVPGVMKRMFDNQGTRPLELLKA